MKLSRVLLISIIEKLRRSEKGIVIYGPRQVGKTTLVNEIIRRLGMKTLVVNGDQRRHHSVLSSRDLEKLSGLVKGHELLFVDEAQRISEIGINLKIILDNIPSIKVIVTGSSSLDLASKISEPLTGRIWTYRLYPISFLELSAPFNRFELDASLEQRLIYGSYPEIFSHPGDIEKREYLQNLVDAYLYKDLLELGGLRNSAKISDLLKLLAFRVGSQVSLSELAGALEMGKDTVSRYLDFLEKSFVIFRLGGLSRNLRKEVAKMDKIYFYDLGVRNMMIDNLKPLIDRDDVGQLWENFLIAERMKYCAYTQQHASTYFWRTYTGAELDYIEEREGILTGYEFTWGKKRKRSAPSWTAAYPKAEFHLIDRKNYLDFILGASPVDSRDASSVPSIST